MANGKHATHVSHLFKRIKTRLILAIIFFVKLLEYVSLNVSLKWQEIDDSVNTRSVDEEAGGEWGEDQSGIHELVTGGTYFITKILADDFVVI